VGLIGLAVMVPLLVVGLPGGALIAGPALAGVIVAAPHLGLSGCYLIDTVTFTAALYGIWRLPPVRGNKGIAMPAFARYRAPAAEAGTGRDAAPLGGSEHLADVEPGG
jgi:hypothetical protein